VKFIPSRVPLENSEPTGIHTKLLHKSSFITNPVFHLPLTCTNPSGIGGFV